MTTEPYSPYRWTRVLPTVPGYYWDRLMLLGAEQPTISHISRRSDGVLMLDGEGKLEFFRGREWAGPILPPDGYAP